MLVHSALYSDTAFLIESAQSISELMRASSRKAYGKSERSSFQALKLSRPPVVQLGRLAGRQKPLQTWA